MKSYRRLYVEKRPGHDAETSPLLASLRDQLEVSGLEGLRILRRYDFPDPGREAFSVIRDQVFSDPATDVTMDRVDWDFSKERTRILAVEYLPGQYDARADAASQLISLLLDSDRVPVKCGRVYLFHGQISDEGFEKIRRYLLNPVDSREVPPDLEPDLCPEVPPPAPVPVIEGFTGLDSPGLAALRHRLGLAMFQEDIELCRNYFRGEEGRDPTLAELKILDTYWSDHCRHTTFRTSLEGLELPEGKIGGHMRESFLRFRDFHGEKDFSLMDLALSGMRILRKQGRLDRLEVSEEVNACSVRVKVSTPAGDEAWLLMFKNETHNHPTEIEPFGGAATCLGGAIRDPLSGRAYVYQAMRLTGSADPRAPLRLSRPGKLPQRVITTEAAHGYSSYGNQVGIATGFVHEIYHPGYEAKRMEIGAVIGAVPEARVRREKPLPGDVVLLVGGETGRDGIGGATGSSRGHTSESLTTASAEVQKGNPLEERALQRYFREEGVASRIKRSNDFGAGGVSVAVGELADGVEIDLGALPRKYAGLNGLELALSESQERMAVVAAPEDEEYLIERAAAQNLRAVRIARITGESRLRMFLEDQIVADISRSFLDSSGAPRHALARILPPTGIFPGTRSESPAFVHKPSLPGGASSDGPDLRQDLRLEWLSLLGELNNSGREGLVERFDSTIGARTVLFPFGGKYQLSPAEGMASLLPVPDGKTDTVSIMSAGCDPYIASWSPYHGGMYAVVEAVARAVSCGASPEEMYLSLQEYFERMDDTPEKWGKPVAALLGAFRAQLDLGIAAVGGKDSMSGSFEELNVPPTLAAFAAAPARLDHVISPEFKGAEHPVFLLDVPVDEDGLIDLPLFRELCIYTHRLIAEGLVISCRSLRNGGLPVALSEMCFGNGIGIDVETEWDVPAAFDHPSDRGGRARSVETLEGWKDFSRPRYGSFIVELGSEEAGTSGRLPPKSGRSPEGEKNIAHGARAGFGPLPAPPRGTMIRKIGKTRTHPGVKIGSLELKQEEMLKAWRAPLEEVFPLRPRSTRGKKEESAGPGSFPRTEVLGNNKRQSRPMRSGLGLETAHQGSAFIPRVCIPVFPGTNCEDESSLRFREAGAEVEQVIFRWKSSGQVEDSIACLARALKRSQILMLPGGFSAGDEPDGSAKYIAAVLRSPTIREAVTELLEKRDGLILGICNGFQALVRTGLLPFGEYRPPAEGMPTLGVNEIGRHVSRYVETVTVSTASPWLKALQPGDRHQVPVSHGEGRFDAPPELLQSLAENGQIAFQYCGSEGEPAMDYPANPNGSALAVEGLISPGGRILGKMGHSERIGRGIAKNIPGEKDQHLFESAVRFFSP